MKRAVATIAAATVLLGAGCSAQDQDESQSFSPPPDAGAGTVTTPPPTSTPLPSASFAELETIEHRVVPGRSSCAIGPSGATRESELDVVSVSTDEDGLTDITWSGASSIGGEADLGWYVMATSADDQAALQIGVTSTDTAGLTAFVSDTGTGQNTYLGDSADGQSAVTVDGDEVSVSLADADTQALGEAFEWSATATEDQQEVYFCPEPA